MLLETLSGTLNRALAQGNSGAASWTPLLTTLVKPSISYAPNLPQTANFPSDGVYAAGDGGEYSFNRIKLLPLSDGLAGTQFSVRVYAWNSYGEPSGNVGTEVWIPTLLVELLCTTCNQPGPPAPSPGRPTGNLLDTESLCDTITLTQGQLGPWYSMINSTGPGTDLVACAVIDLLGARLFSFDFQQVDPVNMNCLWARC